MARVLAILLVLGSLGLFLTIRAQGVERAFGGALARFASTPPKAAAPSAPARPTTQDWWEKEERPPPRGIGQGVRERVNDAMETGERRYGGS